MNRGATKPHSQLPSPRTTPTHSIMVLWGLGLVKIRISPPPPSHPLCPSVFEDGGRKASKEWVEGSGTQVPARSNPNLIATSSSVILIIGVMLLGCRQKEQQRGSKTQLPHNISKVSKLSSGFSKIIIAGNRRGYQRKTLQFKKLLLQLLQEEK